jgi:hypothetical protein
MCSGYYPDGHRLIADEAALLGIQEEAQFAEGDWAVSVFCKYTA